MPKDSHKALRISSAAQAKPTSSVGFRFLNGNSAKSVPMKYVTYKPPKVIKTAKRWYVEYYYRIPDILRPFYGDRNFERFRVFEDINRYKSDEYANLLCKSVAESLAQGYNPFEDRLKEMAMSEGDASAVDWTIKEAFEAFIQWQQRKGLEPETVSRYTHVTENFYDWLKVQKLGSQPVKLVRRNLVERYLNENRDEKEWSNRQYNNIKNYIKTLFEYLVDKEAIAKNPAAGIPALKTKTKKHRYFDNKLFPKVTSVLKNNDPYLWYMVQFVYYLAVRSNKELRALKVRQIVDHGEYFRFEAETSKSDREDLIPVDPHLREVIEAMGLLQANPEHYIFTADKKPGTRPLSADWINDHWNKIRKMAGLSQDYTVYGFKHTRAVHLLQDRVSLADISKLFRHTDIATTAKYARDLGVDFDASDLLKKSRKI